MRVARDDVPTARLDPDAGASFVDAVPPTDVAVTSPPTTARRPEPRMRCTRLRRLPVAQPISTRRRFPGRAPFRTPGWRPAAPVTPLGAGVGAAGFRAREG